MNVINFGQRPCEKVRQLLDSYLSNELLIETNHEVLRHLESCKECTALLENRIRVKNMLQRTVKSQTVPSGLREKVQRRVRSGFSAL